jgi:OmpA-OmpF porin, OOP family
MAAMKHVILLLMGAGAHVFSAHAQNLVPNPGFEEYEACPGNFSEAAHEFRVAPWRAATTGIPDYFNSCSEGEANVPHNWAGVSDAYEGHGYAGIYAWMDRDDPYREYLQCQLLEPLLKDSLYTLEFHYKLSSYSKYAIDRIGLLLTDKPLNERHDDALPFTPTLSVIHDSALTKTTGLWETARMEYKAAGGEHYLVIGNFFDNEATKHYEIRFRPVSQAMLARSAYYYIDAVSVVPHYRLAENVMAQLLPEFSPAGAALNTTYVLKNIRFELDSYKLTPSSFYELDQVAEYLVKNPALKVQFFGHTDDRGGHQYNLRLSRNRARTAADYIQTLGIQPGRIEVFGYGKQKPLATETTEQARALNRRVEIRFIR